MPTYKEQKKLFTNLFARSSKWSPHKSRLTAPVSGQVMVIFINGSQKAGWADEFNWIDGGIVAYTRIVR